MPPSRAESASRSSEAIGGILEDSQSRVAVLRLARSVWSKFAWGWRLLPMAARVRWVTTVVIGFIACAALVWLLTWGGRRLEQSGRLAWERPALERLSRVEAFPFHSAHVLETLGASTILIPIVLVATGAAAYLGSPLRALSVPAGFLGSKALVQIGWWLWDRARPDFIAGGIAVPASLHSYPSGHASQTLVVYGLLTWFWVAASQSWLEKAAAWVLLVLLVGLVGAARLRIGAHWPSDIAAALIVGGAWLATLVVALRRAASPRPPL
jgi:undecaprenyl-diphosphatase